MMSQGSPRLQYVNTQALIVKLASFHWNDQVQGQSFACRDLPGGAEDGLVAVGITCSTPCSSWSTATALYSRSSWRCGTRMRCCAARFMAGRGCPGQTEDP